MRVQSGLLIALLHVICKPADAFLDRPDLRRCFFQRHIVMHCCGSGFQGGLIEPCFIFQHIQRILQFSDLRLHSRALVHDHAEGHAVAVVSGIAKNGGKPVFGVSSAFLQRAYDQLPSDLALNSGPAVILAFFAGTSQGSQTHMGIFDIPLVSKDKLQLPADVMADTAARILKAFSGE